ncbi:MAG: hypothetical protein ACLS5R_03965 [Blautia sp.]
MIRYEPSLKTEHGRDRRKHEPRVNSSRSQRRGQKWQRFILKDLLDEGIYLVTAEFDQGPWNTA